MTVCADYFAEVDGVSLREGQNQFALVVDFRARDADTVFTVFTVRTVSAVGAVLTVFTVLTIFTVGTVLTVFTVLTIFTVGTVGNGKGRGSSIA